MLEIETCSGIEIISNHATPSSSIPSGLAQNSSQVLYFCLVIDCCCAYPTVSPGAKFNTYLIASSLCLIVIQSLTVKYSISRRPNCKPKAFSQRVNICLQRMEDLRTFAMFYMGAWQMLQTAFISTINTLYSIESTGSYGQRS